MITTNPKFTSLKDFKMLKIEFSKNQPSSSLISRVRSEISQYADSNASLSVFAGNIDRCLSNIKQKGWSSMMASTVVKVKLHEDYSKVEIFHTTVGGNIKGLIATITDDGIKAKEFPWD